MKINRFHFMSAEQNMDAVWDAVALTIRRAAEHHSGVELIAITGLGGGWWLVADRVSRQVRQYFGMRSEQAIVNLPVVR